jgi:predicted nucleotidyltransferase
VYAPGVADEVVVVRAPRRYTLEELARRAAGPLEEAGAERAIVFGSWARGTADGFSDLDLAVVLRTDLPVPERGRRLAKVVEALPVAVELLVYTPEEFERGMRTRLGVFDAIARDGVTIHARRPG